MKHSVEKVKRARVLRAQGFSYSLIGKELGVAKSTLSYWLSTNYPHIFNRERQLKHLEKAREFSRIALRKRKEDQDNNVKKIVTEKIQNIKVKDVGLQKIALSMLYWAEGTKHEKVSGLIFTNTDPLMINMYVKLLENTYKVDRSKFKIRLHLHYYHPIIKTRNYWQDMLCFNKDQFTPYYIKKRGRNKKFRKNFFGICVIRYPDSNIRKELMEISKQFAEIVVK